MRILSISGQNIASLADRFEIDLTAPPLSGAGLFAITGETGAGKSSILDAMCLALYGKAPRLANGDASDEVPDPSGEAIKAQDARAILRRGATQGWAKVRFVAQDGQEYIAIWEARRARDKADGKLQNVNRSLIRAADEQPLANQIVDVNTKIEILTGLDYDQFRRTVLLAQGDFDAFLRAEAKERAKLLEKVTGTGLYRDISKHVFVRKSRAEKDHGDLTLRRGEHKPLSEEELANLAKERATLEEKNAAAAGEQAKLNAEIDRHTRYAYANDQVEIAVKVEQAAMQAKDAAAADRDRLDLIERAEPLRTPWTKVKDTAEQVDKAAKALEATSAERAQIDSETDKLRVAAENAAAAYKHKEDEFRLFGPQWTKAEKLDAQINSAAEELGKAKLALEAAEEKSKTQIEAQVALEDIKTKSNSELTKSNTALASLAAALPIADRWDQMQSDISAYREATGKAATADIEAHDAEAKAKELSDEVDALSKSIAEAAEKEADLQSQSRQLSSQISTLETQHPQQASRQLADLTLALGTLKRAGKDFAQAKGNHSIAQIQEKTAQDGEAAALAAIKTAKGNINLAQAKVAALEAPSQQADLALSDAARELRLHLKPDAPCLVCGATDHPIHADIALAELAASLRKDLANAKQAEQTARDDQTKAEGQRATFSAQQAQAKSAIAAEKDRIDQATAEWAVAQAHALAIEGCPKGLPKTPSVDLSVIETAQRHISAAQEADTKAQDEIAKLREELAGIVTQRESLRDSLPSQRTEQDTLNTKFTQAEAELARARQDAEHQRDMAARFAGKVNPLLKPLNEDDAALDDPNLILRLQDLVKEVTETRNMQRTAQQQLDELAPKLAGQISTSLAAEQAAKEAKIKADERQAKLDALQKEREPLLGGEATADHRTQFNKSRLEAQAADKLAQDEFNEAKRKQTAAVSHSDAAKRQLSEAGKDSEFAQTGLAKMRTELALESQDLETLFALGRDDVQKLRDDLRVLDDALLLSGEALRKSRQELDERLKDLPETAAEDLRALLEDVVSVSQTRVERIGAIANELEKDAHERQELVGLEDEIAKAKTELDVWEAVNDAIGHSSGDVFARFAQSITLDVLADTANRHLADLNPRYRLNRAEGLALQVEDIDMGGEARATRSLSGGERFLVSLALALALSEMGGKGGLAGTLFIDEGFGSLDAASLDLAINALEGLQSQGRQVGVISHVEAMKDRIPVRIAVTKQGGGKSAIRLVSMETA